MASTSSFRPFSSSTPFIPQISYDVFLSFRGEDTRHNFTDHLHRALEARGILTFRDDELKGGEAIAPELLKAIEESRSSIIVFSEHYAHSRWCLTELVKIMECQKHLGHTVFPIFYHVDPSHVREQTGSFGEAFARFEENGNDEVERWRRALTEVANLSGFPLLDGYEASFLKKVTASIFRWLNSKRTINSWHRGELLGSGSFGTVYKGYTDDGFFFAVKEASLLDQGSKGKQSIYQLEQEISILSQFEHENIVRYYGTDTDQTTLRIFLELAPKGSLLNLYRKPALLDFQVSKYTRQILNGLRYLHERNVIHRDIKCANILVYENDIVKLADFGLAKHSPMDDFNSFKGSAFWVAPEVVNAEYRLNDSYGLAADIWSLGCTVLEMLTQKHPYPEDKWMQALFKIARRERPPIPDSLSIDAKDFILGCLQVNDSDRPTARQLLDHPFVK